jgi:uncharacterized integral membrane protein
MIDMRYVVSTDNCHERSRQDESSAPLPERKSQHPGIGWARGAKMRPIEIRQASSVRKVQLVAIATAILLMIVLVFAFVQTRSRSVEYASRTSATLSPLWTAESNIVDARFGWCLSSAGDVNNDGFDDVLIGASNYSDDQSLEGRACLYLGSPTGLAGSPSWLVDGNGNMAYLGWSLASAGDVNDDGYDDVIIGAPVHTNDSSGEGRAYVYLGSPTGLSAAPSWTAEGDQDDARFGISVASAGDVNNDGYDDVIVGASHYDNGSENEGRAFVYLGSSSGLSSLPSWSAESDQAWAHSGISVSSAGDVDNDGYGDVIVGAYQYDNGEPDEGSAYVYLGSSSGLSPSPSWTAESDQASAFFGSSVSSAGDVNNDLYDDVIVGAHQYNNGHAAEGRVFVYLGSSSGPSATPSWTAESDQDSAHFGYSVASAGDVDDDGYDDIIVGAHYYSNVQTNEGAAFLYLGSSSGLPTSPTWTAESDLENAWFGCSVSSAGDANGDGFSDVLIGAWGYANGESDEGRAYLYGGEMQIPEYYTLLIPVVGVAMTLFALRRTHAKK